MHRERVAEDIYIFLSERYAQVSMGAVVTDEGIILIDTFPFPAETQEIADFLRQQTGQTVRYVINTHHHADHTYGNYLFPEAEIIAHRLCRELLATRGAEGLRRAKADNPELTPVEIRLPDITFEDDLYVHLGERSLHIIHVPSHTSDTSVIMIEDDDILFTGDLMMPVPYIVWGDWRQFREALEFVQELEPENIVQGHGDILLRGELRQDLESSIAYLDCIYELVQELIDEDKPESELANIDIESCGKSRIPLDGLVKQMHQANLLYLYRRLKASTNNG
jgi:glyoxylase-like metal-dependent hydrolase (beta-lactamase superfamily II)